MQIRRVVTGHDQQGKAIVQHDELCTNVISRRDHHQSCVIWSTSQFPIDNQDSTNPLLRDVSALEKTDTVFVLFSMTQVLLHEITGQKQSTMQ